MGTRYLCSILLSYIFYNCGYCVALVLDAVTAVARSKQGTQKTLNVDSSGFILVSHPSKQTHSNKQSSTKHKEHSRSSRKESIVQENSSRVQERNTNAIFVAKLAKLRSI